MRQGLIIENAMRDLRHAERLEGRTRGEDQAAARIILARPALYSPDVVGWAKSIVSRKD